MELAATSVLPAGSPWLPRTAWFGRVVVGLYFLTAAVFKALHPAGFAPQIDSYDLLLSSQTPAAAFFLITLEFLIGAALVLGARPRLASAGAAALLAFFIVLMTHAWSTGRVVDCGCFGGTVQKGPGATALIDLGLVVLLVPTFLAVGIHARRHGRLVVSLIVAALGVGLAVVSPRLPVDSLVTNLSPGKTVLEVGLESMVPEQGEALVALLSVERESSIAAVQELNEIMMAIPRLHVVAFASATQEDRAVFTWTHGVGFPVDEIAQAPMDTLARDLPRFALFIDGRVVSVWNETLPEPEELQAAMGGTTP
jgi:uncharacterized membrane protein YphA (DoxX/SURF4 family)